MDVQYNPSSERAKLETSHPETATHEMTKTLNDSRHKTIQAKMTQCTKRRMALNKLYKITQGTKLPKQKMTKDTKLYLCRDSKSISVYYNSHCGGKEIPMKKSLQADSCRL